MAVLFFLGGRAVVGLVGIVAAVVEVFALCTDLLSICLILFCNHVSAVELPLWK